MNAQQILNALRGDKELWGRISEIARNKIGQPETAQKLGIIIVNWGTLDEEGKINIVVQLAVVRVCEQHLDCELAALGGAIASLVEHSCARL